MTKQNLSLKYVLKVDDIPLEEIATDCKKAENLLSEQINWIEGIKVLTIYIGSSPLYSPLPLRTKMDFFKMRLVVTRGGFFSIAPLNISS